jgi:ankyrin repeat protein
MGKERREMHRAFRAADRAYRDGDLAKLRVALGDPPCFPNCVQPHALGCGDFPLEYAIYWSPVAFVKCLLDEGADPNYPNRAGFPSLIAALSTKRPDKHKLLALLLASGADPAQRGNNDWTPLHYAVALRDIKAVRILIDFGADPALRTRIDDCTTPMEDAASAGFKEAVRLLGGAGA